MKYGKNTSFAENFWSICIRYRPKRKYFPKKGFENRNMFVSFIKMWDVGGRDIERPGYPKPGQEDVFMLRECVESIFCLFLTIKKSFSQKLLKNFFSRSDHKPDPPLK
jgi:hypothetical protein